MADRKRGRPGTSRDRAPDANHEVAQQQYGALAPDIAAVARLLARVRARIILEEITKDAAVVTQPVPTDEVPHPETRRQLLLRVEDVAEALSVGRSKVYELIRSGELPSIHIGRSVRVSLDDVHAWIRQKRAAP